MEDTSPSRPVMDIRPQRPVPQPMQRANVAATPSRPVPAPAPAEPVAPPDTAAPEPEAPAEDQAAHTTHVTEMKLPPKHRAPIAAILIALLVAGSLIGLTVFAYMKTQDDSRTNQTATTDDTNTNTVTPSDVDTSVQEVEQELNSVNDATDFSSNDLTDESLGL